MTGRLVLDDRFANANAIADQMARMQPFVSAMHQRLHRDEDDGLGWVKVPQDSQVPVERISETAAAIRQQADVLLVVGIGGSYLGARAAVDLLAGDGPAVRFAGYQLSAAHFEQMWRQLEDQRIVVNVVSKSGSTLEPAIIFRLLWPRLVSRYGPEEARRRVVVTTGAAGALRQLADAHGFRTLPVPENIGGRYSVLTAVGLLPMAVAGIDIHAVLKGAQEAAQQLLDPDLAANPAYRYAVYRNWFYRQGKIVELLVTDEPRWQAFGEWWKQLFSESEGKNGQGLFPATAQFTTDLHSLGQYIQQGRRILFETFIDVEEENVSVPIPEVADWADGFDFLAGKSLHWINRQTMIATRLAHADGGVPNLAVRLPKMDAYWFGQLVYFFLKACAMSGYLAGVNPFDQPGVEAYKRYAAAVLGQPGTGEWGAELKRRILEIEKHQ